MKEKKAQTAGLARLQKWCGVRDRTAREVREKMREVLAKMATPPSTSRAEAWSEDWMTALREDHYVDDARCAESYTRVHHEHKSWGPLKIKAGLASRGVGGKEADRAIQAIPEDQWQASANRLLARREDELEANQNRVIRWSMQRGFPQRMVWTALDHVTKTARREAGGDS